MKKEKVYYGWVIAGAGLLISITGIGARYSFGVFLKSLEAEFGMPRAASSGIFSVYMLICCFVTVLGGWVMDKYGPRLVSFLMGSFIGLSFLLTSRATAPWQLFITYSLLLSLGTGSIYTVVNSTASRWFVKKRGLVIGITSSGGGMGIIIVAPFTAHLISAYDWRTAFVVVGLIIWVVMAAMSMTLRKDPRDMGLLPDGIRSKNGMGQISAGRVPSPEFSLRQASRMRQFWLLGLTWLLFSLNLHMIIVHIVPYAAEKGVSAMDAAFILSLIGAANIPGRLIIGRVSDIIGRRSLGIACAVIQVIFVLWLLWAQDLWMFYAFAVAFGFLWGGSGTVITAIIGDIFGTRSLGAIMGMMSAGWALGAATGPAIAGYVYDASENYFMAFIMGAVSLSISAFLIALIRRVDPAKIGNPKGVSMTGTRA